MYSKLRTKKLLLPNNFMKKSGVDKIEVWLSNDSQSVERWVSQNNILNSKGSERVLGFDIEWKPVWEKGQKSKTALIQFATESSVLLIQPLHMKEIPPSIILILRRCIMAGVGVHDDLKKLKQDFDIEIGDFVDVGVATKRLLMHAEGKERPSKFGLAGLASFHLGVPVLKPKRVQISDWSRFALSDEQISYAANDAIMGKKIYEELEKMGYSATDINLRVNYFVPLCDESKKASDSEIVEPGKRKAVDKTETVQADPRDSLGSRISPIASFIGSDGNSKAPVVLQTICFLPGRSQFRALHRMLDESDAMARIVMDAVNSHDSTWVRSREALELTHAAASPMVWKESLSSYCSRLGWSVSYSVNSTPLNACGNETEEEDYMDNEDDADYYIDLEDFEGEEDYDEEDEDGEEEEDSLGVKRAKLTAQVMINGVTVRSIVAVSNTRSNTMSGTSIKGSMGDVDVARCNKRLSCRRKISNTAMVGVAARLVLKRLVSLQLKCTDGKINTPGDPQHHTINPRDLLSSFAGRKSRSAGGKKGLQPQPQPQPAPLPFQNYLDSCAARNKEKPEVKTASQPGTPRNKEKPEVKTASQPGTPRNKEKPEVKSSVDKKSKMILR